MLNLRGALLKTTDVVEAQPQGFLDLLQPGVGGPQLLRVISKALKVIKYRSVYG